MLYRKITRQDSEVEKYKCRLVAQSRVLAGRKGALHGVVPPIPAVASIRIPLATTPAKDVELRHLDAEHAFLKANIDEEVRVEIS